FNSPRMGLVVQLRRVLNSQNMPARHARTSAFAAARNNFTYCHFRISEKSARHYFTGSSFAQSAQTNRLLAQHSSKQYSSVFLSVHPQNPLAKLLLNPICARVFSSMVLTGVD